MLALQLVNNRILRVLFKSQNWLARSWPDQSFWERNRLFPRVFYEKPSPSCILQDLTDPVGSFWLKVKFSLWRKWLGRSVLTHGKRPEMSFLEQVTHWPGTERSLKSLQTVYFPWLFGPNEFLVAMFLPKWHLHHI